LNLWKNSRKASRIKDVSKIKTHMFECREMLQNFEARKCAETLKSVENRFETEETWEFEIDMSWIEKHRR
jgi:hypothetical protein